MSQGGALRRKKGSPALDPASAAAPGRTLGRGDGGAAAAAAAAAAGGGVPFGHGLGPRGVGLPPPPRARGLGGGSAAPTTLPATAAFSMDGGGFPSSPSASIGFPFPPTCFDVASVDPSSPGSCDNKDNKEVVGPFMLEKVWKICRDVPKWKTYNDNLKNARKRKSFHLEGDCEENDDTCDEMPDRPIGQKKAKMAALAAKKGKGSSSSDDGQSKESPIELDKFERYSKFQETNNDKRMQMLDRQEKIASNKLEATRIAQLTAQDYKEGKKFDKEIKMMETYNNLASQDISSMSDEEKAQRVRMMQKLEKALFPEID